MSFPRYPKYKASGVEWLGDVPEGWDVRPLKRVCHVFPSNVDKKSHEGEIPVRLCNYTDVYYNVGIILSGSPLFTGGAGSGEQFWLGMSKSLGSKRREITDTHKRAILELVKARKEGPHLKAIDTTLRPRHAFQGDRLQPALQHPHGPR